MKNNNAFLNNIKIILPLLILIGGFLYYIFNLDVRHEQSLIQSWESQVVETEKDTITQNFNSIISDLEILTEVTEYINSSSSTLDSALVENYFLTFSQNKKIYDQVRYIDNSGKEIIRVDYNNGNPSVKEKKKLQNKKDRYYFTDLINLNRGEIFVSPLDLNIENGSIERVEKNNQTNDDNYSIWRQDSTGSLSKPVIRFGTPIFDANNNKIGIIIINYFGAQLLDLFDDLSEGSEGFVIMANSEGYWLKGIEHSKEWGFMQENEKANNSYIKNDYPLLWEKMKFSPTGQFYSNKNLFTYLKIFPLKQFNDVKSSLGAGKLNQNSKEKINADEYYWTIISFVPEYKFNQIKQQLLIKLIILYIIFSVIIIVGTIIISRLINKTKKRSIENKRLQDQYDFISTLSHQLRTPISAIMLNCGVLRKQFKDQDLYNEMHGRLQNLNSLIDNLLIYNEIKDDYLIKNTTDFSFYKLIKDNLALFSLETSSKKIKVKVSKPDFDDMFQGDRNKINKTIFYLISNAVNYNKEKGEIKIDIAKNHNSLTISIHDTGIGIPKKDQSQIFSKFYRASNASLGKNEGSGISLYLARVFIEGHGGKIRFISTENISTTFSVTLPIVKA